MVRFLFASYFCSWTRFHGNVARSNDNPSWRVFQSYGVVLRFVAGARSWRPFWWGWRILRCLQKNVICRRIVENNALLEKLRSPRKTERRRSTYWFERDFRVVELWICCQLWALNSSVLKTVSRSLSSHNKALDQIFLFPFVGLHYYNKRAKKQKKVVNKTPGRRNSVVICKQFFPRQSAAGHAKIFPLNFQITHGGKYCEETWIPLD